MIYSFDNANVIDTTHGIMEIRHSRTELGELRIVLGVEGFDGADTLRAHGWDVAMRRANQIEPGEYGRDKAVGPFAVDRDGHPAIITDTPPRFVQEFVVNKRSRA